MKLQSLDEIRNELSDAMGPKMDFLSLKVENTGEGTSRYLLSKGGKYTLFARPNGFQLSGQKGEMGDKSFSINYNEIVSLQLLPSVSKQKSQGVNWLYVLFFGVVFLIVGELVTHGDSLIAWLPCGLVFGAVYSANRTFCRKNILLHLDDDEIFFSLASGDINTAKEIFHFYLGGKFEEE